MSKSKMHRSPRYPSMGLPAAIEKLSLFFEKEGRHQVQKEVAAKSLGYNSLNGSSLTTIAALCQYGLLDQIKGMISISDDGWTILEAPKNSNERSEAITRSAENPTIFYKLKEKYGNSLPSDEAITWELKNWGFTGDGAKKVIKVFRETTTFETSECSHSRVDDEDCVQSEVQESQPEETIEIGDLVNWESQGMLQFAEPKAITGFSECNEWVFVEGNKSGLPINDIILVKKAQKVETPVIQQNPAPKVPAIPAPPVNPQFQQSGPSLSMDIFGDNHIEIRLKKKVSSEEWEIIKKLFDFSENTFLESKDMK